MGTQEKNGENNSRRGSICTSAVSAFSFTASFPMELNWKRKEASIIMFARNVFSDDHGAVC